jgi:signal transduction histidine kinase
MPSVTAWSRFRQPETHTMKSEANFLQQCQRGFFVLLALIVPILVGYDVYFQLRVSALDFTFNPHTGLVYEVPFESYADWAGLWPGDVILTVDDVPFFEWINQGLLMPSEDNYMMAVERDGQTLTIEMPNIPLAKANLLSLSSAVVAALTFWGIGVLLLLRRFRQPEVRLLFPLSQAFAILLLFPLAHPAPSIVPKWAMTLSSASFYVAAPLLLHYYLTFPVALGAAPQRRRWLSAIYGLALISVLFWLSGHRALGVMGRICVVMEIVAAVAILLYVYSRRATPDGRRRLRIVVFGNVIAAVPCILFYILPLMTSFPYRMPEWLVALFLIVTPLSYLYATVQHNLFGIDRLLNRASVYAFLSLGILVLYLGPFLLIYCFAPGDLLAQMMIAAGLTLLVGLTFDWSRTRVQRLVDCLFYGGWYDYPGVVETVSNALARSLDREQLTDVLTRQVPELMQLRFGYLWIGEPDETTPAKAPEPYLNFIFTLKGQEHALWSVGPRRDEEAFSAADQRILKTLAHQAEIALSNVLLVETLRRQLDELRASRETLAHAQRQLLQSREEERSRLARDLHDGPIQTLVGLNMQLGLLPASLGDERVPPDEPLTAMCAEVSAMRAEVRALLSELRQVCAELRPPMLDTLGLGAAIRALVEDWSVQSRTPVALDLPSDAALRSLPGDVAVNLYRVTQEALSNVARHAEARQVAICLLWENARLTLTIRDDGRGFDVPAAFHDLTTRGHFGLVGMQERLGLIGSAWTVESAPGCGTTVRAMWEAGNRS